MLSGSLGRPGAVVSWLCLLIALGACGPGTVGTGSGTGDDGGEDIQFTPAGLCAAPFAEASLACAADIRDPDRGTARVQWADANKTNEGASVLAVLEVNGMTLQIACLQVSFTGRWGELPDGTLGFVGRSIVATTQGRASRPSSACKTCPRSPMPSASCRSKTRRGSSLYGPWLVRRVDGAVVFAACTP